MSINKNVLLAYLEGRRHPMAQLDGAALVHTTLCEAAPLFYVHLLTDRATDVSHKREILWNWLTHPSASSIDCQSVVNWLKILPAEQSLKVIELVSDLRINRHRARTLVLSFLLGHGQFARFAATRKRRIIRLLKHVLGERTWSSVKRALAEKSQEGEALLARELLSYAQEGEGEQVREALLFLADLPLPEQVQEPLLKKSEAARRILELGESLPMETLSGLRGVYHKETPLQKVRKLSAPLQRSLHIEGQLTTAYKELLTSDQQTVAEQAVALHERLQQARVRLPHLEGRLGLVLDLSASMASSGERLYYPAALAFVMLRQLCDLVSEVVLVQVGGSASALQHFSPSPLGASDLATALLKVLHSQPDLVLIISDGYENQRQGDVEQVVAGLKQLEMAVPIYQVVPLFASSENLEQRRLGAAIPVVPLTHEEEIRDLLAYTLLAIAPESLTQKEMELLQDIWYGEVKT